MSTLAFAMDQGARHSRESRNPFHAGHVFRGFLIHAFATACQVARPLYGSDRCVEDVLSENRTEEEIEVERKGRQSGRYKKVCTTDPDATMATNARNRRLEPAYKQRTAVDDKVGVILDVGVTTGQTNKGEMIEPQVDEVEATTGIDIKTVTADAGYAYAKVYGALERRGIDALIPTKAEPIRSAVPLRRFRYDAKNDIVKCPRGKVLRSGNPVAHGRFFYARKRCAHDGGVSDGRRGPAALPATPLAIRGLSWRSQDLAWARARRPGAAPPLQSTSNGWRPLSLRLFCARPSCEPVCAFHIAPTCRR